VVCRFQGVVSQRRWRAYRSVDHLGCLQPLPVALPGGGEDEHGAGASDLRSRVSRVWLAGGDTYGQRGAVRLDGDRWTVAISGVVDEAGDCAGADRGGTSGAEWASRAHAPHLEARDGDACGPRPARATTLAGRFSARVQPGSPARGTGHGNASECVSTVTPRVSRADSGTGVSQQHAGTQCEAPRGLSLEETRRVSQ